MSIGWRVGSAEGKRHGIEGATVTAAFRKRIAGAAHDGGRRIRSTVSRLLASPRILRNQILADERRAFLLVGFPAGGTTRHPAAGVSAR